MICKLCLQDKELLKGSHIIPNFMYKGLFGSKHRLVNININNLSEYKYVQTGFKESGILCAACDNALLGKLERYASNTIFGLSDDIVREEFEGDDIFLPYIRYRNLDYTRLKLFFLSILWKSHISSHGFFREINLGSKYAEKIRRMILENDPGPEDEFEVVLIRIQTDGTRPSESVIEPRRLKAGGNTSYVFHINGIMYHFNISSFNKDGIFEKGLVKKDGILDIGIIKDSFARSYFDSYLGKTILMKSNIKR